MIRKKMLLGKSKIAYGICMVNRDLDSKCEEVLERHGVNQEQYCYLLYISQNNSISIDMIEKYFGKTESGIIRDMKYLRRKEFVKIEGNIHDKKGCNIKVTEKFQETKEEMNFTTERWENECFKYLTPMEKEILKDMLWRANVQRR
ncbi:MAG: hypothetical protein N4A40_17145 [Tissierellales bacterium]|nr:hypothetical protein [Tissierellales bacterium]